MVSIFKKACGKKEASPEAASAQLLKAAKKLFSARGFDGVTVRDLADEAQVNLSLVSYHFGGKEGLYRKCLEDFGKARLNATERLLTPPESKAEMKLRFTLFCEEFLNNYKEDPEMAHMVFRECEAQLPIVGDIFEATFFRIFMQIRGFFQTAKDKGFLAADIDPQMASQNVMGMLAHAIRMDPISKRFMQKTLLEDEHRQEFCRHLVRVACDGILAKGN